MSRFKENDVPIEEALEILEIDHSSNNSNYKSKKYKSSNNESLYDQLYKAKNKLAAEEKMSSFIIATNASIKEMAFKRPVNLNEIANIKGFGMKRAKKYGHIFFLDAAAPLQLYREPIYPIPAT